MPLQLKVIQTQPMLMLSITVLLQVAADAISRWLYPQLEPQLRLLDLSSEPQQHRDFLAGWIELLSTAPSMMPFDKVSSRRKQSHAALPVLGVAGLFLESALQCYMGAPCCCTDGLCVHLKQYNI